MLSDTQAWLVVALGAPLAVMFFFGNAIAQWLSAWRRHR
jgi:hypothetical protein